MDDRTLSAVIRYAPYYCEENVWWLARDPRFAGLAREVVLVSNEHRTCALFHQRAADAPGAPVVWDYHVVLAIHRERGVEVWDLDCELGAPLTARAWLDASFGLARSMPPRFWPRFRVIDADLYVAELCSDRGHMRDAEGRYHAPPPSWPCIGAGEPNLMRFVDVTAPFLGETIDLDALTARWCGERA